MGDILGGKSTTTNEIPAWLEQPARRNIGRAEEMSQMGYMPNFGPHVAAFAPQQVQAMRNVNKMADAYGMGGGGGLDIPKAKEFAGGISGYSSMPMFREMREKFAQMRPGQMDLYNSQFINPVTGAAPTSAFAGAQTQAMDPSGNIVNSGQEPGFDLDTGAPWGVGGEGAGVGGEFGGGFGQYGGGEPGGYGYGDGLW